MSTATSIRRHIFCLPEGQLFTTRELLAYGLRGAVDQVLFRLVKTGVIERLARGVFRRESCGRPLPSAFEVAQIKAQSFGKQLAIYGEKIAYQLGLITKASSQVVFYVNGSSSSFKFGNLTIHFRKTCARRMRFGDSPGGKAIRALWYLGKFQIDAARVAKALQPCLRQDLEEIRLSGRFIPAWLNYSLNGRYMQMKHAVYVC